MFYLFLSDKDIIQISGNILWEIANLFLQFNIARKCMQHSIGKNIKFTTVGLLHDTKQIRRTMLGSFGKEEKL